METTTTPNCICSTDGPVACMNAPLQTKKHFIDLVPGDLIIRPHSKYVVEVASVERPPRARKRVTVTFTNGEHYTHYDSYWATMAPGN